MTLSPSLALWIRRACDLASVLLAFTAVYIAGLGLLLEQQFGAGVLDNIWAVSLTVGLGLFISFTTIGGVRTQAGLGSNLGVVFHLLLIAVLLGCLVIWTRLMLEQEEFFIEITAFDNITGWIAVVIIGYVTYRFFGLPMLLVYAGMAVYVVAPASVGGGAEDWVRVAENLWFSTDGVFGRPVEVVSRIVLIFIVFGAILQTSGAGEILLKFAFAATGRFAGGPAHAAIVGSAMFGTLSGAAVANVVSTGVFTIPIIKRAGFKAKFAGAVEAAASTGGQIMPPVMGVVAFLMSDVTGIPYLQIVAAALLPAVMYYASLFFVVLIDARKQGVGAIAPAERLSLTAADWLKSLAFWIPLTIIVLVLLTGRTAQNAGFIATLAATVLCLILFPGFRRPARWWEALVSAGHTAGILMLIVAAIGFVIGVINMTGLGIAFAEGIDRVAGTGLFFSLIMVMFGCLIMGMGVPSGAAYLIIAIVLGPALERLGLPTIAAHLFVAYFGVLPVVTPPVALAAFAAAPIAGSRPMETGFEAVRLSIAGFIIPFVFVYHQDLLLIVDDFSITGLFWALAAFALGIWCIATALCGYEHAPLGMWQRLLRSAAGLGTLLPLPALAIPSALAALGLIVLHNYQAKTPTTTEEHP